MLILQILFLSFLLLYSCLSFFRPSANKPSHLPLSMPPLIFSPGATSLLTQIGWPGKLPKALPSERISTHYHLSGKPWSEARCCHCLFSAFTPVPHVANCEPRCHLLVGPEGAPMGPWPLKNRWDVGNVLVQNSGRQHEDLSWLLLLLVCVLKSCSCLVLVNTSNSRGFLLGPSNFVSRWVWENSGHDG